MPTLLPDRLLKNITILVPNGTTQHGNERILCLPITSHYWPSISAVIIFFAANFLAHAATVKSSPGDATHVQACNAFLALVFPMSGLLRALNALLRYSRAAQTELYKACNAGALCMVVRDRHWRPEDSADLRIGVVCRSQEEEGEEADETKPINAELIKYLPTYARERPSRWVHFDSVWAQSYVDPGLKRIHGIFTLPEGYTFAIVPKDTILRAKTRACNGSDAKNNISASKSNLKAVASMVQIVSAFITLLSRRSDLINRWGYASYHLTVIPYLFMTLVNLVGNLCIADYPCLYMVRTETMHEAEKLGGMFEGEVAQTITLDDTSDDLIEELAYSGVTNEDIINFTTKLHRMIIFWGHLIIRYSMMLDYGTMVKPQISSASEAMIIDLHISGATRDLDAEQDTSPLLPAEQIDLSSEPDSDSPDHEEAQHGVDMYAVEEVNLGNEPKFRSIEAESSSRRYRIRICDPPQRSPFYKIWERRRSAMQCRVRRARQTYHSLDIPDLCWSRVFRDPHLLLIAIRKLDSYTTEREFKPANMTKLYYPSCSRFLRNSSPNHHKISRTEISSNVPPPTPDSGRRSKATRSKPNAHTRWGVLLEVAIGLFLVSFFFSVIAALTQFKPGQSSPTERGVMMAWLASGLYGFCLPFMSTSELLRVFFLFPLVSVIDLALALKLKSSMDRFWSHFLDDKHYTPSAWEAILSFAPLAIFVPPIWGFVLVVRMLVEWGNCTRLY